ncbi:MAG: hypothetical protein A3F90_16525 [Deltaproteobacteria bacterium RIFCSPLOWO2_12_FULL_60_19]|nr:MAG: hypothetical protein A3F90_16525 [Deltaproteobacteria bacterium RIFCSPLOWO2_12_FULL_60_19]
MRTRPFGLLPFVSLMLWGCPMEEKFIFFPSSAIEQTPRDIGLAFEDVFFTASDGVRLNGWFVPHPQATTTLLWFHGNAGNISHRLGNLRLLHDKVKTNVFAVDYRGYGRSDGTVSEQGTYRDAEAALRHLRARQEIDAKNTVIFGQSLGAAVATELASRQTCLALILEAPFASVRAMARVAFPWLPIGPLIRTRYEVIETIKRVKAPILILHGDRDEVVPFDQGKQVFAAAPEPKEFYTIAGSHHNDTYVVGGDAYFATIKDFIEKAALRPTKAP